MDITYDLMHKLNNSRYIPSWVKTYMKKPNLKQLYVTNYKPLRFSIYYENEKDFNTVLKQLKHFKNYFTKNIRDLGKDYINIILILSNKVKLIDKNTSIIIDQDNINSGVCIHSDDPNDVHIIIYRKEDLMKVLFHELIHYVGADLKFYDEFKIKNIEMLIQTCIPSLSNVELYFNEAFTEALARYHYTMFSKLSLKTQQSYSIKVVKDFLAFYDCKNLNDFSKLKNYTEKSHAFSYIVIASALLNSKRFISDVIIKTNLNNLENIVYESLLKTNEWYKLAKTNKAKKKIYLKLVKAI